MAFALNDKIKALTPYDPICGEYPIRLDANESYIPFPDEIQAEMGKALAETALNRYPDPYAEKVCSLFAAFYGISPALVTAGDGSDELISIIMSAFLQKGDKVLTLAPDFSMYRFYTGIVECPCVTMEKNADFIIDPQQVIDTARREGARLIVFSNPCNPTSVGLSADEVRRILRGTDALVVLDEAYMDFWDQSLLNEASVHGEGLQHMVQKADARINCNIAAIQIKPDGNARFFRAAHLFGNPHEFAHPFSV